MPTILNARTASRLRTLPAALLCLFVLNLPAWAHVLGRAASNATVTLNNVRVNGRQAFEYWRRELSVNNSTGAVLAWITNIGVLQDPVAAAIPTDIVTTNLTSLLLPKTPELFKYDADGNLTNNGLWSFKWDAENRLTEMESVAAVPSPQRRKLKFGYDWQGRRVSKIVSNWNVSNLQFELSSARKWLWDGTRPLAELEATNSLCHWFTWGADESGTLDGAGGVGGLVAVSKYAADAGTWFTPSDGRGNVAGLVNNSGAVDGLMEYSPFGEVLRASGRTADALPVRFSTKYEDAESGFVYYGRRYYDPVTGRWLSRDPIGEAGGINLYGFVGNDPVNGFDPFGWFTFYQIFAWKRQVASGIHSPDLDLLVKAEITAQGFNTVAEPVGIILEGASATALALTPEPTTGTKAAAFLLYSDALDKLQAFSRHDKTCYRKAVEFYAGGDEQAGRFGEGIKDFGLLSLMFGSGVSPRTLNFDLMESGAFRSSDNIAGLTGAQARDLDALLRSIPGVRDVKAFGSRTTGTHALNSDLDIVIFGERNLLADPRTQELIKRAQNLACKGGIRPLRRPPLDINVFLNEDEFFESFIRLEELDPLPVSKPLPNPVPLR